MVSKQTDHSTVRQIWNQWPILVYFFYEAAHIVLHGKKDILFENVEGTEIDQDKEEEASAFAAKILLKENELLQIIHAAPLNEEMIHEFANKFRTPAGVYYRQIAAFKTHSISYGQWVQTKN